MRQPLVGCPIAPRGQESPVDALADPLLVEAGWTPRFLADGPRRAEAEALYGRLGFEVTSAAVDPKGLGPECEGCLTAACDGYVMLYTRRLRHGQGTGRDGAQGEQANDDQAAPPSPRRGTPLSKEEGQ